MKKRKLWLPIIILALLFAMSLFVSGCGPSEQVVEVGSKNFTEQFVLGYMTLLILEDAGIPTNDNINLGGTEVARSALESGDLHVYWEYTGTAWLTIFGEEDEIVEMERAFELVKERDAENDLVWLNYAPFNNTYTLMMREEHARELGIETISELREWISEQQAAGEEIIIAAEHEFMVREDGFPALGELYGFEFDGVADMAIGLTHVALRDGDVDVAMGFATDGKIAELNLVNLEDDMQFFPVYSPAPVLRADVAENLYRETEDGEKVPVEFNEVADLLNQIGPLLNTETMIHLNYLVEVEEEDPEDVARQWLIEQGLISE